MMVSLNGIDFAQAKFPPDMKLENMVCSPKRPHSPHVY